MSFNYTDDIIDSRDLYKRQQELDDLKSDVADAQAEYEEALEDFEADEATQETVEAALQALKDAQDEFSLPEQQELDMLNVLENEIDEFMHGTALIADDYFKTYAKQYADDLGVVDRNAEWPLNCIDWDEAAEALKIDFSSVEIEGNTYYFR